MKQRPALPLQIGFVPFVVLSVVLLSACGGGGGGGGGTTAGPAAPVVARSLASLTNADLPAQWPQSFRSTTVTKAQLVSQMQLTQTVNPASKIFVQIWYRDQTGQRQTLAILTLAALDRLGSSLTLSQIPASVSLLQSQVYTADGSLEKTLANQDIPL